MSCYLNNFVFVLFITLECLDPREVYWNCILENLRKFKLWGAVLWVLPPDAPLSFRDLVFIGLDGDI